MKPTKQNSIFTAITAITLFAAGSAQAFSNDGSFDRVAQSYNTSESAEWTNPYVPYATGDSRFESADTRMERIVQGYQRGESRWINKLIEEPSADQRFDRYVSTFTRDMLDRGGWDNPYMDDSHYATPHELIAAEIGNGVTEGAS